MNEQFLPMLAEHQAPADLEDKKPADYNPTDEERRLAQKINKMFEKAKKHRSHYDQNWLEYYQFFRGKQWKEKRPNYRHSEVINFVFQAIQSVVPIMTDSRPEISFLPEEPSDVVLAEILSKVADSDWHRNNWLNILTEVIYDGHFFGTGLSYCGKKEETPEVCYRSVDPFYCFPDPNAQEINDERSHFFIEAEPMDTDLIKKKWPEKGRFVKADLFDIGNTDRTELGEVRFISPTDQRMIVDRESHGEKGQRDQALIMTCYYKCEEMHEEQIPETDDAGNPILDVMGQPVVKYQQRLKYPRGRRVVVGGNVILEDGENPFEDGKFPYSKYVNYILPREFWGMSDVEQLKSPQKIFNKLVSYALDVLTLMGNPIWVVDTTSGIDVDNLFNRPGLIVEKEPGSEVSRQEGVQLQPFVLQLIDRLSGWFNEISGANDVTRGVRPEGITAAAAISELQDAAQTRIRQKSRNMETYLQDFGQQYASRVFQFYSAPKIIRITNKQEATTFFKFYVTEENGIKYANIRNINIDDQGQAKEDIEAKKYEIRGKFDVRVATASSLPFAKKERYAVAKELFQLAVIDEEELLKSADYPNYQAVLERVKRAKAEQAALQQAPA